MKIGSLGPYIVAIGVTSAACTGRDLSPKVTTQGVTSLSQGVSYEHVQATLGRPRCYRLMGKLPLEPGTFTNHPPVCGPADGVAIPRELIMKSLILEYAQPAASFMYPTVSIQLKDGAVSNVSVGRDSAFMEREVVYLYNRRGRWGDSNRVRKLLGR